MAENGDPSPFIRTLDVEGYRSLRKVRVLFSPLTAFVGPNAAGKSSLLRALNFENLRSIARNDFWRNLPGEMRIAVAADGGSVYEMTGVLTKDGAAVKKFEPGFTTQALHLDLRALREANQLKADAVVDSSGKNLPNVFGSLPRRIQDQIATQLCELTGVFQDVDVAPPKDAQGVHAFRFYDRWRSSQTYTAADVSDGTMLLLALLVVMHQSPPPKVVTIEEPERGLHPYLLSEIVGGMRKLARGEFGPSVQVVLATQSPTILNHLEPAEVRFVSRDVKTGETTVEAAPTTSPDWEKAYEIYEKSLGQMWLAGQLGGV